MRLTSLQGRQSLLLFCTGMLGVLLYLGVTAWPLPQLLDWLSGAAAGGFARQAWVGALVTALVLLALALWLGPRSQRSLKQTLRALETSVASYRDGDYGFSLATRRRDELGDLIRLHNELGQTLRAQRQDLVQRELMLDTMVQNSPQALLLVDDHERVSFANLAARHLLNQGKSMLGADFAVIRAALPDAMRRAMDRGGDSLFTVKMDDVPETFHLSLRRFRVQGRGHGLYLFRRMTHELSRQEVASWKRVIRVISHELNNSLAPIASMTHSGRELLARGEHERLTRVFDSIGERSRHLHEFIAGYARFAKLPAPRQTAVDWASFLAGLAEHGRFRRQGPLPDEPGWFDAAQVEQVLINLLKNAHEAGSPEDDVTVSVHRVDARVGIAVADRGPGMSEAATAQAVLPFYSTKRSGSGLGLALAREVAEAHDGRLQLANREHGGLRVTLWLPARTTA